MSVMCSSRRLLVAVAGSVVLLATACHRQDDLTATAEAKPSVAITQVRVDRMAFDPGKQEQVRIRFNVNESSDVKLSIYDGRDRMVSQQSARAQSAGEQVLAWDGRDRNGAIVPAEAYSYILTASNPKGRSTYDLTDLTGGQKLQVKDVRWDPDAGVIRYYIDKPARVNIRLGLEDGGPYLRTLIDWVPRPAGTHAEAWDGKDASGVLDLARHPLLKPVVTAYALSDNTLFVGAPPDRLQFVADPAASQRREHIAKLPAKEVANRAQQPLETRGDISALLTLAGHFPQDKDGRWLVSGRVPFRADVAKEDRQRVMQRRFEAAYYVDGVFTYENELGYLPMTWTWDASQLNPGEHFVTLNIRGYEGNFGTATVKVLVQPASDAPASHPGRSAKGK
jgi:hypothetical protein